MACHRRTFSEPLEPLSGARQRRTGRLRACAVPELRRFASGLLADHDAVRAAVAMLWSSGQVEGQINRLKLLKRQMYGRTKLPKFPERFRYGQVPLGAKKADLMFLQHMLAAPCDGGMIATVMPHGVLFRGSEEKIIRARIVEDDMLEAVIGCCTGRSAATSWSGRRARAGARR